METLRETQLTRRATRRPCEYNYTNADIHSTNVQPSDGYQFEYPVNWAGDPSTNKVIGLRRINYKPTSVNIAFNIHLKLQTTGVDANDYTDIPVFGTYTSENTFEECLNDVVKQINTALSAQALLLFNIILKVDYNKDEGTFVLAFIQRDEGATVYKHFELKFPYESNTIYSVVSTDQWKDLTRTYYKREFLKLFNQLINKENIDMVHQFAGTRLSFNNVWNRDAFYCHASFSDSPRKIIGINKDFWPAPSVFYEYSDNSNDFNIYFTTDTVHRILPQNGILLIQLSYIFNYQTSYLTYG